MNTLFGTVKLELSEQALATLENLTRRLEIAAQGRTVAKDPPRRRPSFGAYHPDDVVTRATAAQLLAVSPRTTEDWARDGKGPLRRKLGTGRSSRVVYRVGDLLDWLKSQGRASTTT